MYREALTKVFLFCCCFCLLISSVSAELIEVKGTDAIFLANRTDVTIPPLGGDISAFPIKRHSYVRDDFLMETMPQSMSTEGVSNFTFSATGRVDFFNGNNIGFQPDGGAPNGSELSSLEGISGYKGPEGPLVGLFLDDASPLGVTAPSALDFSEGGIGTNFEMLAPELGQVFYIGDGLTGSETGDVQEFYTPSGATRLYLGIADGWSFDGVPGFYEDNDGSFLVDVTSHKVPEPSLIYLLGIGMLFIVAVPRKKTC